METLFGLLGGLAVFLFGMNMMSEGLQKVAGEKMKSILGMLTSNPVLGVLAGALCTAVLQSSSATTVMAIGFVSARLMTLRQAIAVIFGANIGTTITAQLIAFKLSDYIWIIVFIGFLIWFIAKEQRTKNIGQTIFAFGLLFVGIDTMGSVMKPLAESAVFLSMIDYVKDIPILGVLVGTLMTVVVQSSSATIAVLQSFASQAGPDGATSIIGLSGSIPILLGDNIGTTITALLACIGQSRDAKRTAIAHTVFNITGATLFMFLSPLLVLFVQTITPGPELEVIARQIANAHTTFNIVCTLLWLPFLGVMVKIVTFIVPGDDKSLGGGALVHLDTKLVNQPVFAMRMYGEELRKYIVKVRDILGSLPGAIEAQDKVLLAELESDCRVVEHAETELANYAVELLSAGAATEQQAAEISSLMLVVNSVGGINARCLDVITTYKEQLSSKKRFTEEARNELVESARLVCDMYVAVLNLLRHRSEDSELQFNEQRRQIIKRQSKARKAHYRRVSSKACAPQNKRTYDQLLLQLERACNECTNLVEHGFELCECTVFEQADSPACEEEQDAGDEQAQSLPQPEVAAEVPAEDSEKEAVK